jgi:hypothetical protein
MPWENQQVTDISFAVMNLLMSVGIVVVTWDAAHRFVGRAFIYAGTAILCLHAIGIRIVAPISQGGADALLWITFPH